MSNYYIHAISYLDRAQKVFDVDNKETWFYAAFEVRCGVEARMREYLKHQKSVSAKRRKGWKPAVLARDIDEVFKIGEKEAHFSFHSNTTKPFTLVYRPVPKELQRIVEKLGNYMHAAQEDFFARDDYWETFQELIERGIELLEYSVDSQLLGVPLRNLKTNQLEIFATVTPEIREQLNEHLEGGLVNIEVSYCEIS